ncbi:hypothetical protein ONS95_005079 [Cadophora gregata]|uniref:uncharacterized protein n=1 Tax=Cadophora gregata TaxID=51156 RepID=UPI0026DC4A67|nr:uncharacterized protein ONS95_005079 [Cadophora gregata]KAK0104811.1 hypothetical protein ONS95_005079 [Cadophora gregata]
MGDMHFDLKLGYPSWRVLSEMCVNIDKAAKMILRRFGVDYFFDENREFREFLLFWARRFCKVARRALEKPMVREEWAVEVGKILYALLEFLKTSHDALLEREVDAMLESTLELLGEDGLAVTPFLPGQKSRIFRGKIHLIDRDESDSKQRVADLLDQNEDLSTSGERGGPLQLSRKNMGLPSDSIIQEIEDTEDERRRQDEALMEDFDSDSDSDSEDEIFPPLRDEAIHPIWNTKPQKGELQRRFVSKPSKVQKRTPRRRRTQPT